MALEMWRPISVRKEHPAQPVLLDVSTATGTSAKSTTSSDYFCLFKSSTALDA